YSLYIIDKQKTQDGCEPAREVGYLTATIEKLKEQIKQKDEIIKQKDNRLEQARKEFNEEIRRFQEEVKQLKGVIEEKDGRIMTLEDELTRLKAERKIDELKEGHDKKANTFTRQQYENSLSLLRKRSDMYEKAFLDKCEECNDLLKRL
ncbi:4476_t:CDS:2, partial [Racocetra persica]